MNAPPHLLVTPPAPPRSAPAGAAAGLFDALGTAGVRYCHWKSNEHLDAGLQGLTDLDLLIDRRHAGQAHAIFARSGFKRFAAVTGTGYPAVEDYLALDSATGRLLHCHVHYFLVAGERHLKGYRLPWEEAFLEHRRWDAETQVYVADPDLEMVVLLVRAVLKLRLPDLAGHVARRHALTGDALREYLWLRSRIEPQRCAALCRELLGDTAAVPFTRLLTEPPRLGALLRFRRAARRELALLRSHGPGRALLLRLARTVAWLAAGWNQRALRSTIPLRRTVPTGGVLIAFLGADGSGKSTHARATAALLAGKLDVLLTYFGSGDGPASVLRWPLRVAYVLARRLGLGRRRGPDGSGAARGPTLTRAAWALVLALEKRRKLRAAWRARNLGMVVLADRYPQGQIGGFNDGPLLGAWAGHPNPLLAALARWEAAPYHWAERYPPDLVVKLHVSPENALVRKPDTGRAEVERRVIAIRALTYRPQSVVVDVDADRPFAEVSREVTRIVWSHI